MIFTRKHLIKCLTMVLISNISVAQTDLSGNWDNGSGIDFIQPASIGNSICVVACAEIESTSNSRSSRTPPSRPTYKAEFLAKMNDLNNRQVEEDPVLRCYPPGVPRIGPPDKIVQTENEIVFLYDDVSGNFFRVIPLNKQNHRDDIERSFLGDSIGYWDNETLVVETQNFNTETWLTDDGSFHSEDLKVVERISKSDGELQWDAIAYDSVLAEPWDLPVRIARLSDSEILEAPLCIERDLEHVIDGSHHDNVR